MNNVAPRYPLVLVHGMLGFVSLGGYSYWYGIDTALRAAGATVHAARLSAVHGNTLRGDQLLAQVDAIRTETGAERVHLIGHSQGALSARYVAALRPQWVASVTSVAGPNHGSEVADYLQLSLQPGGRPQRWLASLTEGLALFMQELDSAANGLALPRDALESLQDLGSEGVAAFNARYPQGLPALWGGEGAHEVDGVRYYSWSGTLQPGFTDQGRNRLDPSQRLCRLLSRCFAREAGQNDGMVGRFSSHLGQVIRSDYPFDHLDIVNQQLGAVGPGVDPVAVYVEHARRLAKAGL